MEWKQQMLALTICAALLASMSGVVSAENITTQAAKGYFSDSIANTDGDKGFINSFLNNQPTFPMSSSIVDPVGDWIDSSGHPVGGLDYADIVSASVTQIDETHLRFEMQANANIPSDPGHWIAYMWCLDTDRNPDTGDSGILWNDIGADAQPQVTYNTASGWQPYVSILGVTLPPDSFTISGDTITLTVSLEDIGNPTSFDYMTRTYEEINGAFDVAPNSGHGTVIVGTPTVSITTDRLEYSPGDTMIRHLEIDNPTANPVTFNWYLVVPQFAYWGTIASAPIPAGTSYSGDLPFPVGDWGPAPFGMVWYVELTDGTGKVLDSDTAICAYSPGVAVSRTSDVVGAIEESIREAGS